MKDIEEKIAIRIIETAEKIAQNTVNKSIFLHGYERDVPDSVKKYIQKVTNN